MIPALSSKPLRGLRILLIILWVLVCPSLALAIAKPVQVPGTQISLAPPDGFLLSEQFTGFQRKEQGASIMINELPAPVDIFRASFTEENLATRGMTLLQTEDHVLQGKEVTLFHIAQTVGDLSVEKWMLLMGDADKTIMVMAVFPQTAANSLSQPLKAAVLSADWNPERTVDPWEGMPFRITETSLLKVSGRMSKMVTLTEKGKEGVIPPEEPLLVIAPSISKTHITNIASYSKKILTLATDFEDLTNVNGHDLQVDGLSAYEIEADAQDISSGIPLRVYQLLIADGTRYFRALGLVGTKKASQFVPEFQTVARSLIRTQE